MTKNITKNSLYAGMGVGIVLFALFGLLPGSLLGGAMGINIAGWFFGLPLEPGILSRMIVLAAMLIGVLVTGIVMVMTTSGIGWLVGVAIARGTSSISFDEKALAVSPAKDK